MPATQVVKRDVIVENLRRRILSGELARGSRMPQDELARHYEASITPVREALRLLEAEGLLVSEPHRGVRVAGADLEKVKATYVVRRLVETYAMRRVLTRLSPRDLDQARLIASNAGEPDSYRASNREFHFFFYERCGMPQLAAQIEDIWQAFPWDLMLTTPERTQQSHAEHLSILEALEARDADAVAAATEAHISNGFTAIAQQLSQTTGPVPDPFQLDVD